MLWLPMGTAHPDTTEIGTWSYGHGRMYPSWSSNGADVHDILKFPEPVAFSRPDKDTHLVINWPGKGTAYLVSTLMEAAGQGAVLANGMIVHPGPVNGLEALSSESPPPYVLAIAVNTHPSDSALTQAVANDVALDAASVVSEPLLHVPVPAVRTQVKFESFTPEWRERGMILAEGRFTSARIVLT